MKVNNKILLILIILALSLLPYIGGEFQSDDVYVSEQAGPHQHTFIKSYIEHDRIVISSDLHFQNVASTEGWPGNGSESDPYRIENLSITNTSSCLVIQTVTVYFVISGCFINCTDILGNAIEMNNASNGIIEDSFIYHGQYGIVVFKSHGFRIENTTIADCGSAGIYLNQSNGTYIEGTKVFSSGYDFPSGAINIYRSHHGTIYDCEMSGNDFGGIRLWLAEDWLIIHNLIHDNTDSGVYGYLSSDIKVTGNNIYNHIGSSDAGIDSYDSSGWIIQYNWLYNNHRDGINAYNCTDFIIENNEIHESESRSIRAAYSDRFNITSNLMFGGTYGVSITYSLETRIINNTISNFRFEGISLFHSNYSWVFMNDIAFNEIGPIGREDTCEGNFWDDNVSIGNWWGNYDGGENYSIWFEANVDRYPRISLNASEATPLEYEVGTTGHVMNWTQAYARHPTYYEVRVGGVLWENQTWDGGHIEVNMDGLVFGNHSVTLTVYHISGNSLSSLSFVNVIDTTPPTWDQLPTDKIFELGESFSYDLNASDIGGVTHYWVNDTTYFNFDVGISGILTNTSLVPAGVYALELRVYDVSNNYASAIISITVEDTVAPTWLQTPVNQDSEFGDSFTYQVTATDLAGINHYWLNDTTNFNVSLSGLITNISLVPVGIYDLEVRGYDPSGLFCSETITITVSDTISPIWTHTIENQVLAFGESLAYQLEAYDLSGIQSWMVNDTVNFEIINGLLTSKTVLDVGTYILNIFVEDTNGNSLSVVLTVTVQAATTGTPTSTTSSTSTQPPVNPPDATLILVVGASVAGAIVIILAFTMKKKNK